MGIFWNTILDTGNFYQKHHIPQLLCRWLDVQNKAGENVSLRSDIVGRKEIIMKKWPFLPKTANKPYFIDFTNYQYYTPWK